MTPAELDRELGLVVMCAPADVTGSLAQLFRAALDEYYRVSGKEASGAPSVMVDATWDLWLDPRNGLHQRTGKAPTIPRPDTLARWFSKDIKGAQLVLRTLLAKARELEGR